MLLVTTFGFISFERYPNCTTTVRTLYSTTFQRDPFFFFCFLDAAARGSCFGECFHVSLALLCFAVGVIRPPPPLSSPSCRRRRRRRRFAPFESCRPPLNLRSITPPLTNAVNRLPYSPRTALLLPVACGRCSRRAAPGHLNARSQSEKMSHLTLSLVRQVVGAHNGWTQGVSFSHAKP
jgi:hypothetical protein